MENPPIYKPSKQDSSLRQGEILTGVIQYTPIIHESSKESQQLSFKQIIHPYAIIVTQDCDLDWDYRTRNNNENKPSKLLNSIILCEIATAKEVRKTDGINRKEWELVSSHRHERFYFFEKIPIEYDLEQQGLMELTADFKKVFGINSANLYNQIQTGTAKRRSILESPYLEHFSRRYNSFHGRVALPSQYESEKEG
ncbi:hypothetical protein [Cyanothece sp. BG0011]|uniref:hypothetical protein n=1 Tax=Cyanothece sp. BG0011 TaxID=2082950 RepID=UPI000D1F1E64|nr:hypothetical protein [Cyanothece sp. BG0011]